MVAPSHWSNKKNKDEMPSAGETPSTEKISDKGKFPAAYPERPLTAKLQDNILSMIGLLIQIGQLKKMHLRLLLLLPPLPKKIPSTKGVGK